uniref:Glycine cleavage system H protein n=1 Tax=Eucampia antarctica TaxID=49252 RepID=A0A7S2S3M8_9STRA|mmetsp:Transcript_30263/g.29161  ORF Transcript_30263/g.29161 Transcript_30263/m.29161 type:complete len:162 (+) Transcript_30263:90-575(+)
MASATLLVRSVARRSMMVGQCIHNMQGAAPSVGAVRFSSYYTPAHEYAKVEGKVATVGITDFAQAALGDIVFVDLPDVGDDFEKGDSFGSVESVKAASDVYCPIGGTIVEVNESLHDDPGSVNLSPEEDAWFIKLEVDDDSELDDLMSAEDYKDHCEKEAH